MIIKYLNNAIFLIDFFKNILRLIRFKTVPINPIGTIKQRVRISFSQLDVILERNNVFESTVVFAILFFFQIFVINLFFLDSKKYKFFFNAFDFDMTLNN